MTVAKSLCFWCRQPKGFFEARDVQDGDRFYVNYDRCPICEEKYKDDLALFEARTQPAVEGQPALFGLYPTGRYVIVVASQYDDLVQALQLDELRAHLLKKNRALGVTLDELQFICECGETLK